MCLFLSLVSVCSPLLSARRPYTVQQQGGVINLANVPNVFFKGEKRVIIADEDAFDNDFDKCMINRWTNPSLAVFRTSPTAACNTTNHSRLCYGSRNRRPDNAQYISCYNSKKRIPEFTAYIVPNGSYSRTCGRYRRPNRFGRDKGPYGRY